MYYIDSLIDNHRIGISQHSKGRISNRMQKHLMELLYKFNDTIPQKEVKYLNYAKIIHKIKIA